MVLLIVGALSEKPADIPPSAEQDARELKVGVLAYGAAKYVPQFVNFLLLPLLTTHIPPEAMGALEITVSTQALIAIVMRLGIPAYYVRALAERRASVDEVSMLRTTLVASLGSSTVVGGLFFVVARPFFEAAWPTLPYVEYIGLALVASVLQLVPDVQRGVYQARRQARQAATLSALNAGALTLATVALVIGAGLGARGVIWAGVVSSGIFALVASVTCRRAIFGLFDWRFLRESLSYGFPLVPLHAAAWAQQWVGRWVLGTVATLALVGELALATRLASPLTVATGAFTAAFTPVYFGWRALLSASEARTRARRFVGTVLLLGAVGAIGAAAFGNVFVRYATAPQYAGAGPVVGLVAAALFLHLIYAVVSVEIFYSKNTRWIWLIFLISALVNLGVAAVVASPWGATGVAVAQMIGGLVSVAITASVAARSFPLPLSVRRLSAAVAGIAGGCAHSYLFAARGAVLDTLLAIVVFVVCSGATIAASGDARSLGSETRRLLGRSGASR